MRGLSGNMDALSSCRARIEVGYNLRTQVQDPSCPEPDFSSERNFELHLILYDWGPKDIMGSHFHYFQETFQFRLKSEMRVLQIV